MRNKYEPILKLANMTVDHVGNIDMGGRIIDNVGVVQAETVSVGTAGSDIVMQWDGECLNMNASDGSGMVRMSGLADPVNGCDAVTKNYVDSVVDIIVDKVLERIADEHMVMY